MLSGLLSHQWPAGRWQAVGVGLVVAGLLLAPLWPDQALLDLAARVLVLAVLAAAHGLMAGQGGMPCFAHGVFFAAGACGVAMASSLLGPGWLAVAAGAGAAAVLALVTALVIGGVAWRAGDGVFASCTLVAAAACAGLAFVFPWGGPFEAPALLRTASRPALYGQLFAASALLWLLLLRVAGSPFGCALRALRENRPLADAIGYRPPLYRLLVFAISAVAAALAGSLFALWQQDSGPLARLGVEAMLDVLLVAFIGGGATLHGTWIGAALVVALHACLPRLLGFAAAQWTDRPDWAAVVSPAYSDWWFSLLWLLAVCDAIAGWARRRRAWAAQDRPAFDSAST